MDNKKNQLPENPVILSDVSNITGKRKPWAEKKANNLKLAKIYLAFDEQRSFRAEMCARDLVFKEYADGHKSLLAGKFCHLLLCPVCCWRRARKTAVNVCNCINKLQLLEPDLRYIFITLSLRNCAIKDYQVTFDRLMDGWSKFIDSKEIKRIALGHFRGVECTYSRHKGMHPHIHCMLVVKESYFKSKNYLTHGKLLALWRRCIGADYDPHVYIEAVRKTPNGKDVQEVAKYSVKDTDWFLPDDFSLTKKLVQTYDAVMAGRRLIGYGGIMAAMHQGMDDDEDLVTIPPVFGAADGADQCSPESLEVIGVHKYFWHCGLRAYVQDPKWTGLDTVSDVELSQDAVDKIHAAECEMLDIVPDSLDDLPPAVVMPVDPDELPF